jgi:hypothetical protein
MIDPLEAPTEGINSNRSKLSGEKLNQNSVSLFVEGI